MKKLAFTLIILMINISYAQIDNVSKTQKKDITLNGINYKALIKDAEGNVLTNTQVSIQFTILQGSQIIAYRETHSTTTNADGIVIVNIGEGTPQEGEFIKIEWGLDTHALKTEIDTGNGLVDLGTTDFKAVPYALNALNAATATSLNDLEDAKTDYDTEFPSVFIGKDTGLNDEGNNQNTALGFRSLMNNTTGYNNVANGFFALQTNITGNNNTATGLRALYNNITGYENTANGSNALFNNITGYENTATGYRALQSNEIGIRNTAVGAYALNNNKTGSYNTAVGRYALFNGNTSWNVAIGRNALINQETGTNNIGIGYNTNVPNLNGSHQIRMGNNEITYAGIQVAWTVTSDKLWKENIRELPYGLNMLMQLKPVDYVRKNNQQQTREMGFIAQDIEVLLNKIGYSDQGFLTEDDQGRLSLRYNDLIALLTKAIQEQQTIINKQNSNYEQLLKRVEKLEGQSNKK
jgi:hypothetical protein